MSGLYREEPLGDGVGGNERDHVCEGQRDRELEERNGHPPAHCSLHDTSLLCSPMGYTTRHNLFEPLIFPLPASPLTWLHLLGSGLMPYAHPEYTSDHRVGPRRQVPARCQNPAKGDNGHHGLLDKTL